jgi:ketosteroid isomerase-like protein
MPTNEAVQTTTRDAIHGYFDALYAGGWESLIADDILFVSPSGTTRTKAAYVEATNRFKQVAESVDVRQLIVDGENACAVTRYTLRSPKGNTSVCDVAEIFSVKDGKLAGSTIFFDTAAFAKFMAQG